MFVKPVFCVLAAAALLGCASDPVDLHPTAAPTVNAVLPSDTTLDTTPLHIRIPANAGVQYAAPRAKDLVLPWEARFFVDLLRPTRHLLMLEQRSAQGFVVHARQDAGFGAGSGIRYTVATTHSTAADGSTHITVTPQQRQAYQEGLVAQFPLPRLESPQLRQYLRSFTLPVQWQFDLAASPAAVAQHLEQHATVRRNVKGEAAPLPAGHYVQHFQLRYARQPVNYTVTLHPAPGGTTGTQAQVQLQAPAVETAPHTVDFGAIVPALQAEVRTLLGS